MDNLSEFLFENKCKRKNEFLAVSDCFKDKDGNTIMWEVRPLTTSEDEAIRRESMEYRDGKARLNVSKYAAKVTASAVVFPNLFDAKLQDSYNVKTPEALLMAMVDKPGDYNRLVEFVQRLNGFTSFKEDIDKAKN